MWGWAAGALVLLIVGGLVFQAIGRRRDARRLPPPGRMIEIAPGRRRHWHCLGAGDPAVVFEAGIAASSLSWTRVQPRVAEFARACSYDRAGLAWSGPGRGPLTARALAEELHQLLRSASVPRPCVFVAHSFGTFVVRLLAHHHPEDVAGLVLVDPIYPSEWLSLTPAARRRLTGGVFLSRVGGTLARAGVVRACLDLLAAGSTGVPRRVSRFFGSEAASVLRRLVGEVQKLPPDVWPAVRAHWSQPKCFTSMARHLESLPRSAREIADCAGRLDVPVTVISAATLAPPALAEHAAIAAASARGRHVVASKAGHWIHLDEPEVVVDAVREMIAMRGRRFIDYRRAEYR